MTYLKHPWFQADVWSLLGALNLGFPWAVSDFPSALFLLVSEVSMAARTDAKRAGS
jgi:hypothetical protein